MSEPNRQYFEDIQLGDEYVSPGRTITEADIVAFAGLSGDYNVLHTDAEYMKTSIFGERIAHGIGRPLLRRGGRLQALSVHVGQGLSPARRGRGAARMLTCVSVCGL